MHWQLSRLPGRISHCGTPGFFLELGMSSKHSLCSKRFLACLTRDISCVWMTTHAKRARSISTLRSMIYGRPVPPNLTNRLAPALSRQSGTLQPKVDAGLLRFRVSFERLLRSISGPLMNKVICKRRTANSRKDLKSTSVSDQPVEGPLFAEWLLS